jgi:hypothetical protein
MAKKTTLDGLAALVSKGFASADKTFAAVADDIADIKNRMATKEDLTAVETRLGHRIDKLDAKIDRLDVKLTKFEESEIDSAYRGPDASVPTNLPIKNLLVELSTLPSSIHFWVTCHALTSV